MTLAAGIAFVLQTSSARPPVLTRTLFGEMLICFLMVATWIVTGCVLTWPRDEYARHSHLNGPLPKYSSTSSRVMVAVASCSCTPECGSV
uniref:Uncharacterized protein n=1 Tax=Anopheles darlingi TaxID=43151 RepID=A0A2M4DR41_ANODA